MVHEHRIPTQRTDETVLDSAAPERISDFMVWANSTMLDHDDADGRAETNVLRGID